MDTPRAIPLNLLHQLFTPLCDDICCGLFVVEILRDGAGEPRGFVGRVANRLFCELLAMSENDILDTELPESLCQTLTLSALLRDLPISGATQLHKELDLGPDRTCTLQAHLPCPELLTIAIQNTQPARTMISGQAEAILASLGEPCTIIDKNFSILYENEAARKIWGSNGKKIATPSTMA